MKMEERVADMVRTVTKDSGEGPVSEGRQPMKGKGREEEVYVKAAMLFRENGYLNTSVKEIAKELGIQKGSLYYYIENKEKLLFEILNRTMNTMLGRVGDLPSRALPPEKKLALVIHEHIVNAVRYLNEFSVLLHDTKHLRPDLRNIILSKRKQYEDIFLSIIREGTSTGIFVRKDEKMLVYMILGSCNWLYQWFSPKGPKNPEQIANIFCEVFLNGLLMK
jgi:AcrR family transcriptional regulator